MTPAVSRARVTKRANGNQAVFAYLVVTGELVLHKEGMSM